MFATVIVPLDGSPHAERSLPYAIDEARRHDARIVLVRIIPRPEPCRAIGGRGGPTATAPEWPPAELAAAVDRATAYLSEVRRRFGLGDEAQLVVAVGDPAVRLAAEAQRHPRPLLVLTTGHTTGADLRLGEVGRRLLARGAVPVLGVRQPQQPAGHAPTVALRRNEPTEYRDGWPSDDGVRHLMPEEATLGG
jgi:nucleotide-binding universal stress UspA family protein